MYVYTYMHLETVQKMLESNNLFGKIYEVRPFGPTQF